MIFLKTFFFAIQFIQPQKKTGPFKRAPRKGGVKGDVSVYMVCIFYAKNISL